VELRDGGGEQTFPFQSPAAGGVAIVNIGSGRCIDVAASLNDPASRVSKAARRRWDERNATA